MPEHLLQDHARVQPDLFVLIPTEGSEENVWLPIEVLNCRESRADLPSEQAVEDLDDVLPRFEVQPVDVEEQMMKQISSISFLGQLGDEFRSRL